MHFVKISGKSSSVGQVCWFFRNSSKISRFWESLNFQRVLGYPNSGLGLSHFSILELRYSQTESHPFINLMVKISRDETLGLVWRTYYNGFYCICSFLSGPQVIENINKEIPAHLSLFFSRFWWCHVWSPSWRSSKVSARRW